MGTRPVPWTMTHARKCGLSSAMCWDGRHTALCTSCLRSMMLTEPHVVLKRRQDSSYTHHLHPIEKRNLHQFQHCNPSGVAQSDRMSIPKLASSGRTGQSFCVCVCVVVTALFCFVLFGAEVEVAGWADWFAALAEKNREDGEMEEEEGGWEKMHVSWNTCNLQCLWHPQVWMDGKMALKLGRRHRSCQVQEAPTVATDVRTLGQDHSGRTAPSRTNTSGGNEQGRPPAIRVECWAGEQTEALRSEKQRMPVTAGLSGAARRWIREFSQMGNGVKKESVTATKDAKNPTTKKWESGECEEQEKFAWASCDLKKWNARWKATS